MGLNKEQRKHMAAVRKLLRSHDWADVRQGLALLQCKHRLIPSRCDPVAV